MTLTAQDVQGATFDFLATGASGQVVIRTWAQGGAAQIEWSVFQDRLDNPEDHIYRVDVCRRAGNLNPMTYWIMRPNQSAERVSKP